MPFNPYQIKPVNVSNNFVPEGNHGNEIECIANATLANLIRQLGSLSEQTAKVFEDLNQEAKRLNDRAKIANERIQKVKGKASSLDYKTENSTKLEDFLNLVKPFESSKNFDQQLFTKDSMSDKMKHLYSMAESPPDLNVFNKHRYFIRA
jgi:WAS family protein 3